MTAIEKIISEEQDHGFAIVKDFIGRRGLRVVEMVREKDGIARCGLKLIARPDGSLFDKPVFTPYMAPGVIA